MGRLPEAAGIADVTRPRSHASAEMFSILVPRYFSVSIFLVSRYFRGLRSVQEDPQSGRDFYEKCSDLSKGHSRLSLPFLNNYKFGEK